MAKGVQKAVSEYYRELDQFPQNALILKSFMFILDKETEYGGLVHGFASQTPTLPPTRNTLRLLSQSPTPFQPLVGVLIGLRFGRNSFYNRHLHEEDELNFFIKVKLRDLLKLFKKN